MVVARSGARTQGDGSAYLAGGDVNVCSRGGQHFFCVGPGSHRLVHDRGALCSQPGEEHRGLHLCAGHGQRVLDALKTTTAHGQWWEAATLAAVDPGAHQPERYRHPVHRPLGDRRVALQYRQPVDGGDEPGQQADPGARVTYVDEVFGLN